MAMKAALLLVSTPLIHGVYCVEPCIALDDMKTLSFSRNGVALYSDGSSYPQLDCIEGSGCDEAYTIQRIVCHNTGRDYNRHIGWTCEGDLPEDVRFGFADPICEGFRFEGTSASLIISRYSVPTKYI